MYAPPLGNQSILLHGFRYSEGKNSTHRSRRPDDGWFLIEFLPTGVVCREIFQKLPRDKIFEFYPCGSSCARIGSSLYVFGGARGPCKGMSLVTDCVRRLDIENPNDGWKPCQPLSHGSSFAKVGVSGNLIYLFPQVDNSREIQGGILYDTHKEMGFDLCPPPGLSANQHWNPDLCFGFDFGYGNRGVSALFNGSLHLGFYSFDNKMDWEERFEIPPPPTSSALPPSHAFLNGILYLSYYHWNSIYQSSTTTLYAFDVKSGSKQLLGIKLPSFSFDHEIRSDIYLVALADNLLCYLWSTPKLEQNGFHMSNVHLAKVEVSDNRMSAAIVTQGKFLVNASCILSCISFDSSPDIKEQYRRTRKRESSRCKLKQRHREDSLSGISLSRGLRFHFWRVSKRRESMYTWLLNQLRSKDGELKVAARMQKLIKKKQSLEKELKENLVAV